MIRLFACAAALGSAAFLGPIDSNDITHGFVDSGGVKIHYASQGKGPLVVFLHGFPDYWYTWRHQMAALSKDHQAVAIDLRGYNKSDKPEGGEAYDMALLVQDVVAVIDHFERKKAIVVGHDWGGAIAWNFAMAHPDRLDRLIICNLPHPRGLIRELANNPEQRRNSNYARIFQQEDTHKFLTAKGLASWVKDEAARAKYVEAFERSDFEAMLHYYKRNYPKADEAGVASSREMPTVEVPVLMIHGLDDTALLPGALNDTWEWLDSDLTLVTIPGAGHFVQRDARDLVTRTMVMWLHR
ncbi:MAG: alpha/beta hydrolase [Planctomycetota bacterium]|nr:alpha/beta hydrolase [Planctomycetota bacterium]